MESVSKKLSAINAEVAAVKKLRMALTSANDPGDAHILADCALCDLLTALGYTEVVALFKNVEKWYA